ncbi:hypothetical protein KCP74_23835 [Salmonella enterica subsp. enterica]|nr:hypothetical protein KCP74_23835 [Salmonella enterica subsp. enterica]
MLACTWWGLTAAGGTQLADRDYRAAVVGAGAKFKAICGSRASVDVTHA